jgi:spore maturation protein CgeB
MKLSILGLSITSSWGNGHATTYRGLVRGLVERGHEVTFLERDVPWYARERDLPVLPWGSVILYDSVEELRSSHRDLIEESDAVIVGSYVPEGIAVGEWVTSVRERGTAFYDIDTPVTMAHLEDGTCEYLSKDLIPRYDLYLSFTGGPLLEHLEQRLGAPSARALYCSFDPEIYFPEDADRRWDLGYLGTYSDDRQPALESLLVETARRIPESRFVVAGPQYPDSIEWPENVLKLEHVSQDEHRRFYCSQRFTLNVTRRDMIRAGWSPSVRLFEAAACAVPIISDPWEGLDELFTPGEEILIAGSTDEVVEMLSDLPAGERDAIGRAGRERVIREHSSARRAGQLEAYLMEILEGATSAASR